MNYIYLTLMLELIATLEGEDTDGNTSESEMSGNATEVGSSMDELSASEEDSVSSNEESPLPKWYIKLLCSWISNQKHWHVPSTVHEVTQVRLEAEGAEDPEAEGMEEAGGMDKEGGVDEVVDVD